MRLITEKILDEYLNQIINIHHSFSLAFAGSIPYKQPYERDEKLLGANSHNVTRELDDGPIIEQDSIRIRHKDSVKGLERKGRNL